MDLVRGDAACGMCGRGIAGREGRGVGGCGCGVRGGGRGGVSVSGGGEGKRKRGLALLFCCGKRPWGWAIE